MISDPDDRLPTDDELAGWCDRLATLAQDNDVQIGTAESLTAGNLAAHLGRAPSSGDWYCGGIVAYRPEVKHSLLEVPPGPVVSEESARAMAYSTAKLMGAGVALAITGEAGPEPQEDVEPGTVWFGLFDHGTVRTTQHVFEGDPPTVLARTVAQSLWMLLDAVASVYPSVSSQS